MTTNEEQYINMDRSLISVFLIEDNNLTRIAIKSILKKVEQFEIVGETADAESALPLVSSLKPQVVLADIGLPGMNGIEATKRLKQENPGVRVVMLTSHDNDRDIFEAFDAGADGYVIKEAFGDHIELAVKSVNKGTTWLDPRIARKVLQVASCKFQPVLSPSTSTATTGDSPEPLSEHETNVLSQLADEAPSCQDGVCSIDPAFLQRLHRFARKPQL